MAVEKPERVAVKTVKSRAYTTRAGYERLEDVLVLAQQLYNGALDERKTAYKRAGKSITLNQQTKEFTGVRG